MVDRPGGSFLAVDRLALLTSAKGLRAECSASRARQSAPWPELVVGFTLIGIRQARKAWF